MNPAAKLLMSLVLASHSGIAWTSDACSNRAILTAADVTVSDGSTFKTESFFHSRDGAAIKHIDDDERITVVEGPLSWTRTGDSAAPGTEFHKNFALGHQFHALLLHFEEVASNTSYSENLQFLGNDHSAMSGDYPFGGRVHLIRGSDNDRPTGILFEFPETAPISVVFLDWQRPNGDWLPFHVQIDDGQRVFDYHFTNIDIGPKSPLWFFESVNAPDIDQVLVYRLHRKMLAAHCLGDARMMSDLSASNIVVANRGELQQTSNTEMRERFAAAFERFDYTGYHDLVTPIIKTSKGGDVGWIWVNVRALGLDRANGDSFDDRWAWAMIVEKIEGNWLHVGNASNIAD